MGMPNYRGHVIGGSIAYALLLLVLSSYCVSLTTAFEWFLCAFAGALFPDIDTKSRGQKYFYWLMLCIFLLLILKERLDLLAVLSVFAVAPLLVPHRGLFHRVWFITFLVCISWVFVSALFPHYTRPLFFDSLFFMTGALSHIWLDMHFVPRMRSLNIIKRRRTSWGKR
jgi:hypothetical protein